MERAAAGGGGLEGVSVLCAWWSGATSGAVLDDFAVAEDDFASALVGEDGVMGDHDDGVSLGVEVVEDLHDFAAGGGVEVAGGLVGEEDVGLADEGAGDGDALELAAGELLGVVSEPSAESEALGVVAGEPSPFGLGDAAVDEWEGDVVDDVEVVEEVEGLEDEADVFVAEEGESAVAAVGHALAVDFHDAAGGDVEESEQVHEGGLAGAGAADDHDEFAGMDVEVDAVERGDGGVAHLVVAFESRDVDDGVAAVVRVGHGWVELVEFRCWRGAAAAADFDGLAALQPGLDLEVHLVVVASRQGAGLSAGQSCGEGAVGLA